MKKILNDTKIKYLLVCDKLYKVTDINFSALTVEASEIDLLVSDVAEEEIFGVEEFKEFYVRLHNKKGVAEVVNFTNYVKNQKLDF